jgi:hypothetical protein
MAIGISITDSVLAEPAIDFIDGSNVRGISAMNPMSVTHRTIDRYETRFYDVETLSVSFFNREPLH